MNEWSDMAIGKLNAIFCSNSNFKLNLARCRFEHILKPTISFRCFLSIFHPLKFYSSCNSLQLGNQLKSSPTCMQFVPETQPRMEFDERLAVPVVEAFIDFDLQFTQRSESKVNNTHSAADERRARRQECEFSLKICNIAAAN